MTNQVSSIRLFILGTLSASGPLHGHQIRQQAQSDRTEIWTDIQVGSVYGALKRLANEGLVRELRTERVGNRPERTVYEITGRPSSPSAPARTSSRSSPTGWPGCRSSWPSSATRPSWPTRM